MNSLSWLLYFAEVSSNIFALMSVLMVMSGIALIIVTLFIVIPEKYTMSDSWLERGPKLHKGLLVAFIVSCFGVFFPSQNTIYMIIASESAEAVVVSEEGQKIIGDIQNIVSLKLNKIAEEMTNEVTNSNQHN